MLGCGHATGSAAVARSSYSIGVSMPSEEWRRWRLWKISRYSNRALASSIVVFYRCRLSSSVWTWPQNGSVIALSSAPDSDARERSVRVTHPFHPWHVIWPIHHVASVPAIMGVHGTIASVPWTFMHTVVSPECALLPRRERCLMAAFRCA